MGRARQREMRRELQYLRRLHQLTLPQCERMDWLIGQLRCRHRRQKQQQQQQQQEPRVHRWGFRIE